MRASRNPLLLFRFVVSFLLRLGAEQIAALIQESVAVAHETGALATKDLQRVVVDTTVQPKAIAHPNKFRVWISGQVRRVTATIRREMKRRSAVEPVIGHLKADHRMDRNFLKGYAGDRANALLAAAGYNFRLLLRWLTELLRALFRLLVPSRTTAQSP